MIMQLQRVFLNIKIRYYDLIEFVQKISKVINHEKLAS